MLEAVSICGHIFTRFISNQVCERLKLFKDLALVDRFGDIDKAGNALKAGGGTWKEFPPEGGSWDSPPSDGC